MSRLAVLLLGLAALASLPARGQELVLTLSTREVAITSTYTGADVTAFGLIERDVRSVTRTAPFEIVATVQGPVGDIVVHRKGPLGPIWLTAARERFARIPTYFALLTARPASEIVDEQGAQRLKLRLTDYLPPLETFPVAERAAQAEFREALVRLSEEDGALHIDPKAVTMVRPNLFSVRVNVPGRAPVGLYVINVSVVSEGVILRTAQAGFVVRKVGFDAAVADAAKNRAPLYALITVMIAVLLGWFANFAFRRD
jgi:uncharacterized protein (TIGR02186 family)